METELPHLETDADKTNFKLRPDIENAPQNSEELIAKIENAYKERIYRGEEECLFSLGQFYYEQKQFENARKYFKKACKKDPQAAYQLAVMCFDGIGGPEDQTYSVKLLQKLSEAECDLSGKAIQYRAQYLLGTACYNGFGVRRSDQMAERWWVCAADDGNPNASIKAQTILGLFYSSPNTRCLEKAFFWHNEACGNGSLESQGCLGVLYENGFGTQTNPEAAFECYRRASERGSVYAMGCLVACYYKRRMFSKCVELGARVSLISRTSIPEIAEKSDCLVPFILKGIAMACFYYARCLQKGSGIKPNKQLAQDFFSKAFDFDPDVCARLQADAQLGLI